MAIKELFYDQRPVALINPRESLRIDPRFTFTRDSTASYFDSEGLLRVLEQPKNTPRFDYDPNTNEFKGLLLEPQRTNIAAPSEVFDSLWNLVNVTVDGDSVEAPDGTLTADKLTNVPGSSSRITRVFNLNNSSTYSVSLFVKIVSGTSTNIAFEFGGIGYSLFLLDTGEVGGTAGPGYIEDYPNGWKRIVVVVQTPASGTARLQAIYLGNYGPASSLVEFAFWGLQIEEGAYPTSYIRTPTTVAVTREADLISIDSLPIPGSGSLLIDAEAIETKVNSTLASIKNASNQKLNLAVEARTELYNSPALVYSIQGAIKPTLPFPVPTTNRERNIITWGANNYQYTTGTARFAQSLSGSVPANLTQLSIGSDSVDPTKAFSGYINAAYLYSGEITPAVAEALVRGELDPINADTFVPSGPAGSLSIVVNTQGAGSDGDRVFELPAESAANNNDIVITWGDGTESGLENAAAELGAPGLTKTYSSAGIYPIFVEGQLENLKFNNIANAPDLVQIVRWGTTANGNDVFLSPSTLNSAFYGCSQLDFSSTAKTTNLPDTSGVTDWFQAFRGCSSITGMFPQFNFSSATTLERAFQECSSITSFTPAGTQTQNVTNFGVAWFKCSSLTSFPLIDTSSATTVNDAWRECSSLTAFPLINTGSCTNFNQAWLFCTGLTSFPLINTSSGISFVSTWNNCDSLTSFPLIDTSSGTDFTNTWARCRALTSFPLLNTSSGTIFNGTWIDCNALTSFPLVDTSSGTNFRVCWQGCFNLASFPLLDTSSGTTFLAAWTSCSSLTSFPAIDTSAATTVNQAWYNCASLTSFPALDFGNVTGLPTDPATAYTGFVNSWRDCSSLANFPANLFNTTTCTSYFQAFLNCALTVQSIENILVSIESANTSNGVLSLEGGTNAAQSTWSTAATTAYNALVGRGWTITFNP